MADLGSYYISAQRYLEAEKVYDQALDALANCMDPDGVRICTELQGDVLGYRGLAAYAQGKTADSLPYLERATARPDGAIHPELKLISLVLYSKALKQLGHHQEAQDLAQRAAEYKSAHPDAARRVGADQ